MTESVRIIEVWGAIHDILFYRYSYRHVSVLPPGILTNRLPFRMWWLVSVSRLAHTPLSWPYCRMREIILWHFEVISTQVHDISVSVLPNITWIMDSWPSFTLLVGDSELIIDMLGLCPTQSTVPTWPTTWWQAFEFRLNRVYTSLTTHSPLPVWQSPFCNKLSSGTLYSNINMDTITRHVLTSCSVFSRYLCSTSVAEKPLNNIALL